MNIVLLTGRLTRDPDIRYTSATQTAVATFNLAVERDGRKDENGKKLADFPRIQTFGKQAEACEKYIKKGSLVNVEGKLQTGSYENNSGDTVYTTDVVAHKVEFLEWNQSTQESRPQPAPPQRDMYYPQAQGGAPSPQPEPEPVQEQFEALDEDVPF